MATNICSNLSIYYVNNKHTVFYNFVFSYRILVTRHIQFMVLSDWVTCMDVNGEMYGWRGRGPFYKEFYCGSFVARCVIQSEEAWGELKLHLL